MVHHTDLTVDVRDAVGDRMHISDEFQMQGVRSRSSADGIGNMQWLILSLSQTSFEIGRAQLMQNLHNQDKVSASKMIRDARGRRGERRHLCV